MSSVINVAVMKDLYTIIDPEVGETVMVERLLADIDGKAKGAIDRLILGVLFPPSLSAPLWISRCGLRCSQ